VFARKQMYGGRGDPSVLLLRLSAGEVSEACHNASFLPWHLETTMFGASPDQACPGWKGTHKHLSDLTRIGADEAVAPNCLIPPVISLGARDYLIATRSVMQYLPACRDEKHPMNMRACAIGGDRDVALSREVAALGGELIEGRACVDYHKHVPLLRAQDRLGVLTKLLK
jgi:hypothetical protein